MKSILLPALFLLLAPGFARAQAVAINNDGSTADPSAILDVKSADKGMLVPRMTTAQRAGIAAPAGGLLVYDTDAKGFWFYSGTAWVNLGGGATSTFIADTDGNTKVQTEKNPNENIIRMDLGGTEVLVLRKNAAGRPRLELWDSFDNTFVGPNAGNNTTGSFNTALGANALNANTAGISNTAVGHVSMFSNTIGLDNTATGSYALYANTTLQQHTHDTGQVFSPKVREKIFEYSGGQPWLTNALAREITSRILLDDYTQKITPAHVEQAKENLIVRRDTHLDSLLDKLRETRVRNVVMAVINGEAPHFDHYDDAILYCRDLGIVTMDRPVLPKPRDHLPRDHHPHPQQRLPRRFRQRHCADAVLPPPRRHARYGQTAARLRRLLPLEFRELARTFRVQRGRPSVVAHGIFTTYRKRWRPH